MAFAPNFDLIEELKWRGLYHQSIPGVEELLTSEQVTGYVGFDPTADSLHIGNMVPIVLLVHLQRAGHKPIALVGGATGMVGDPSGKKAERTLLDLDMLNHNLSCQKNQLEKFLNFDGDNAAEMANNYDWFKNIHFLEFIRDVGKHITVNYMLAKDSVKNRIDDGISFTEFSYQLVQGYDFYHLWSQKNCKLQMGGSDQWGNIVTGTELIRRKAGGEAYAITAPLLTKPDGSKFGKSEGGNVWLDINKTSAYQFYQFWKNTGDEEAERLIKIFTLLDRATIEELIANHKGNEHLRGLQTRLAQEVTRWVHGEDELQKAEHLSGILFSDNVMENLKQLSENDFLDVFSGAKQGSIVNIEGKNIVDVMAECGMTASKGEAKRAVNENSVSVNTEKVKEDFMFGSSHLIGQKFVLLQRGKKNYFLLKVG
ncbi:MAG: tyrosine--tRNA ligase [Flavobacteriales bacterium]|nr:tyrosine--tRNA ligase [Flavobacteriales bacterium]